MTIVGMGFPGGGGGETHCKEVCALVMISAGKIPSAKIPKSLQYADNAKMICLILSIALLSALPKGTEIADKNTGLRDTRCLKPKH